MFDYHLEFLYRLEMDNLIILLVLIIMQQVKVSSTNHTVV